MITLNQELIVAKTQAIKFDSVRIEGGVNDSLRAEVTFCVLNELNQIVGKKYLTYSGEEFNTFWEGFSSGKFLYEKLVEKESLPVIVDSSIEEDFVNTAGAYIDSEVK